MNKKNKLGWLLTILAGVASPGAQADLPSEKFARIGQEIQMERSRIGKIKNELHRLESDLGDNNLSYLNNLKQIENSEKEVVDITGHLEQNEKVLNVIEGKINEMMKGLLTRLLDEEQEPSKILERKLLQSMLREELQRLAEGKKDNRTLSVQLVAVKAQLEKLRGMEVQISKILLNLEEKKKSYEGLYQQGIKGQHRTIALSRKAAMEGGSGPKKIFSFPLAIYEKIQFKDKGITFKFKGVQPVQSVKRGTVIYSGPLSTFGNVIVLDHGDSTRTVILGQFRVKTRKNDVVDQGEILGYTFANDDGGGNLYFEVRKNNTVQKAISWIDQSRLKGDKGAKRQMAEAVTTN